MTLQQVLEEVQKGTISVQDAEQLLRENSYEEMGYAKLDTSRKQRTGFAEVIYCSNKADEHLLKIFDRLYREDGEVLGTRASEKQYELVKKMDRQQFNRFCENLYNQGKEAVKRESLTSEEIRSVLLTVKGIGEKRADEIVKKLEDKVKEKECQG